MKKLLAIAVVFALVAGAAFAETAVSGTVETRLYLMDYTKDGKTVDGKKEDSMTAHGSIGAAYIQLSGTNDDGTLGGLFRLRNTDIVRSSNGGPWFHRVFVWWRPIEQVKIFLGIDNDGLFDTAQIAGWSFHSGDNDYLFNHHWDFWRSIFPGNWDGFGLALSFYPMDGLNINVVFPTGALGWPQATQGSVTESKEWEDVMIGSLRFQVSYNLDGIGQIQFAWNLGDKDIADNIAWLAGINEPWNDDLTKGIPKYAFAEDNSYFGRIGVSFLLTSIENIQILVGGAVVPFDDKMFGDSVDPMILPGAAFTYSGEGFGVKARVGAIIWEDLVFANFNIMPYFTLGPGELMIDFGMSMDLSKSDYKRDKDMGWFATPTYRLPLDGGKFSIGMHIFSNIKMGGNIALTGNDDVRFAIPMLLAFNF